MTTDDGDVSLHRYYCLMKLIHSVFYP